MNAPKQRSYNRPRIVGWANILLALAWCIGGMIYYARLSYQEGYRDGYLNEATKTLRYRALEARGLTRDNFVGYDSYKVDREKLDASVSKTLSDRLKSLVLFPPPIGVIGFLILRRRRFSRIVGILAGVIWAVLAFAMTSQIGTALTSIDNLYIWFLIFLWTALALVNLGGLIGSQAKSEFRKEAT